MKIIFATPGISYLRYFGPVIEYIQDEKNIEIIFAIRKDSNKYLALGLEENYYKFLDLLDLYFNSPEIINDFDLKKKKIRCDVLFTLCGVDNIKFDYKKHYAIQHCYDQTVHGKNSDSKTIHIVNNEIYGQQVQSKFNTKFIVAPIPVAFSNLTTQIEFARKFVPDSEKVVTIFFPRDGSIRLVRSIVKYLKELDYFTVIKQRRKNQRVPNNIGSDLIVYDDIWYPSESIFFPAISEFAIGFGSSIWTDLCDAGIPVIDNSVPKYVRKCEYYIRAEYENYWRFNKNFRKNTFNAINEISSKSNKSIVFNHEVIKDFYLNLLNI